MEKRNKQYLLVSISGSTNLAPRELHEVGGEHAEAGGGDLVAAQRGGMVRRPVEPRRHQDQARPETLIMIEVRFI